MFISWLVYLDMQPVSRAENVHQWVPSAYQASTLDLWGPGTSQASEVFCLFINLRILLQSRSLFPISKNMTIHEVMQLQISETLFEAFGSDIHRKTMHLQLRCSNILSSRYFWSTNNITTPLRCMTPRGVMFVTYNCWFCDDSII